MERKEQIDALLFDAKIILEDLELDAMTWEHRYHNEQLKLQELKSLDAFFSTKETRQAVKKAERRKNKYKHICFKMFDKIDIYRHMVDAIQKAYDIG